MIAGFEAVLKHLDIEVESAHDYLDRAAKVKNKKLEENLEVIPKCSNQPKHTFDLSQKIIIKVISCNVKTF